jgi:hypothetical protein
MTPGSNIRRTVHAAANLVTGAFHHHVSVKNVSVVFCYFLDLLLAAYPDAPIVPSSATTAPPTTATTPRSGWPTTHASC